MGTATTRLLLLLAVSPPAGVHRPTRQRHFHRPSIAFVGSYHQAACVDFIEGKEGEEDCSEDMNWGFHVDFSLRTVVRS